MSTQDEARKKILDKIQKCMRLSKSSEPHEAAAAMRQAQKMMEAHQVSDAEIVGLDVKSIHVITPSPYKRKTPMHYAHLVSIISAAFGVQAIGEAGWKNGRSHLGFRYFGIGGRPELAAYAHEVIFRQLHASWNKYKKETPWVIGQKGARMGFWVGWLSEVRSKVVAFAGTEEEVQLVRKAIESRYPALSKGKSNNISLSGTTHGAGQAAASDFSIHKPMTGQKQHQLH